MASRSPSFKLGVLNMTISFDQPKSARKFDRKMEHQLCKMHPVPRFIPRYRGLSQRHVPSIDRKQATLSPYQNYRNTQKASLRYYRQNYEYSKHSAQIAGISPEPKDNEDLAFNRSFTEDDTAFTHSKSIKGTQLKKTINKRQLRQNMYNSEQKPLEEQMLFNFQKNPEQNLKGVFTVRPIKTSFRYRKQNENKGRTSTRQQLRNKSRRMDEYNPQNKQKVIRPWSPLRNGYNKDIMLQSDMIQSNYPHA